MIKKTEKDPKRPVVGNTNSTTATTEKSNKSWFFTLNNYTETDIKTLKTWFDSRSKLQYIFQQEKGSNGTRHLQGTFKCQSGILFSTLKKQFPNVHFEKTKSWADSVKYCSKDDTRDGDIYTNMDLPRAIVDDFSLDKATDWQKKIIELVNTPADPRKIHWFVDTLGNTGKTTLARHLAITFPNKMLYLSGKCADIKYGVSEFLKNKKNDLKFVIFDMARTIESKISYQAIEEIKNGIFYSSKYDSGMVVFNRPVIIVLSNFNPKLDALSLDRWDVYYIDNDPLSEDKLFTLHDFFSLVSDKP